MARSRAIRLRFDLPQSELASLRRQLIVFTRNLKTQFAIQLPRQMHATRDGLPQMRRRVPTKTGALRDSAYARRSGNLVNIGYASPKASYVRFKKPIRKANNVFQALRLYGRSSNFKRVAKVALQRAATNAAASARVR